MEITSLNNEKVKCWEKLKAKKYRDKERLFLIEDDHLVCEAIKKGLVKEIITSDFSYKSEVPTYYVTDKIMKLLSSQVTSAKIIGVCNFIESKPISNRLIVLDNIQDPGNLGTIIRSAVAFNFDIVLSLDTVDIYNPKVIRATEGMIFNINIIKTDIINFLNDLDSSYLKITTDVKNGEDIRNIKNNNVAIVIGNEGMGVRKEISDICDKKVNINTNNKVESLNASVSASILMYEVYHE